MTETLNNNNRIDLESADVVKKKYENMTYDEMSQHMAESFRQMSEMLGNRSIASSLCSEEETSSEMIESDDDNKKWTNEFIRTASNGEAEKLKEMLSDDTIRPFIDINARDSDGTPPLIYASCFGKTEIAQVLVEAGAHIDAQDGCKFCVCDNIK
jgi:hypothetical protein